MDEAESDSDDLFYYSGRESIQKRCMAFVVECLSV